MFKHFYITVSDSAFQVSDDLSWIPCGKIKVMWVSARDQQITIFIWKPKLEKFFFFFTELLMSVLERLELVQQPRCGLPIPECRWRVTWLDLLEIFILTQLRMLLALFDIGPGCWLVLVKINAAIELFPL